MKSAKVSDWLKVVSFQVLLADGLAEADGALLADEVLATALARAVGTEEQLTELFPPAPLQLPVLVLLLFVVSNALHPAVISTTQARSGRIWRAWRSVTDSGICVMG